MNFLGIERFGGPKNFNQESRGMNEQSNLCQVPEGNDSLIIGVPIEKQNDKPMWMPTVSASGRSCLAVSMSMSLAAAGDAGWKWG
jgi:hypothetical protein